MTIFCKFESEKYKLNGAYHWSWYKHKAKYIRQVNHVKEWIKEKNGLDVGAGDGLITHVLGIKGIDYEPEAVRLAKEKGVDVILGDARSLPFKDEEFEYVFMGDTLEHLEFPQKAISEARRVLTKYLYIVVSIREGPFRITQDEFKKMVESEGFVLEGETWVEDNRAFWGKFKKI